MRYIEVEGLRLSVIGLGTWQFGSREWGYGDGYATDVAPALVRRAVELGVTFIDTAEAYGPGRSERIVGAAVRDLEPRPIVATKLTPIAPAEPIVAWQARGSARRLGVDTIDLYQVHWPNPFVSPRRAMQAIRPLVEDGLVAHVGVSNFSLDQWREAERALRHPVISNQVRFSLASPGPLRDLVPYAADRGRVVIAYSPLGQGLLTGRHESGVRVVGMRRMTPHFRGDGLERSRPLIEALRQVATAHAATPAQVALAWLLGHPNVVAIPGARTVEQLEENVAAADLELSADEVSRLTAEAERLEAATTRS
jgi:aryl-alcohol dehydrogenase-like predicted oxidoreductase